MTSIILSISLLAAVVSAELEVTNANGTCRTVSARGQQQYCLWTNTYNPPAEVNLYGKLCGAAPGMNVSDSGISPICNLNESFTQNANGTITYQNVISNVSCVDVEAQFWEYYEYTWECCLCPPGWVTVNAPPLYCGAYEPCARCSGADEELVFIPIPPINERYLSCITTTASSTSTSTSSTTSSTVPPATSIACGSINKRDLLTDRAEACNSCLDLTTLSDPALAGSQTVINTQFVDMVKGMISCATTNGFMQLYDASSSRCYRSKGKFAGTLPSPHLIGMAMDVNLDSSAHGHCNRQCFLEAYCVHNLNFNLCQPVLHTFSRRKPNVKDTAVYNFITCAGKIDGMVIGAKIPIPLDSKHPGVKQGDWDHFQGVPTGRYDTSLYDTYHPQLVQFCQGRCANAPLNHPSDEACPQPPKATCASHGIDFQG